MKKYLILIFVLLVTSLFAQNYLLDFDGVDDYIAVPNADSLNMKGPYPNRTIEMWFKADILTGRQTLYEEGGRLKGFHIYLESDTLYAGAWNETETSWDGTWYHHNIFANKWYHVALVLKDGTDTLSNNKLFAYINGYEFSSGNKQGTKVYQHIGDIHIARHAATKVDTGDVAYTGDYFDGRLNEIRIWNVARTQDEIKNNMHNEVSTSSTGLIAYWNLDDGSGTTATDVTGVSGDGTLTNMDPSTDWISSDLPSEPAVLELMFSEISDNKTGESSTTGFIEVYNPSSGSKDVGGYKIVVGSNPTGTSFTADSPEVSYTFPSGTTIDARGVLTIGNGATRTAFNAAWGTSLGTSYYLSGSSSLVISSGKAYALDNGSKSVVDTSPELQANERRIVEENDLWGDVDSTSNGTPGNEDTEQDLPLPVVLSKFTASFTNGKTILSWTTMSEENNNFWNVYRSVSQNYGQAIRINDTSIPGANTTSEQTNYLFTDETELNMDTTYYYWIESIDYAGDSFMFGPVEVEIVDDNPTDPDSPQVAQQYGLISNSPNPFNPSTEIKFAVKKSGKAVLAIYNIKGQKVATLFNGFAEADKTIIKVWNATNITSGVYFYKLTSNGKTYVKKMLLMK